jgi:prepilin-type N-terminal cleavage/methylation domain-containing protein/prepilin-type processing-associated H-X9-DG protein
MTTPMTARAERLMTMKRKLRAFTLVELLVVIGIIGVLLSILLPSLNRARAQANLIDCASNLKNIGNLVETYAAENRGFFPYGRGQMHWNGTSSQYLYAYGDWNTPTWYWTDSLALLVKPQRRVGVNYQNEAVDYPNIMHDVDTVQLPYFSYTADASPPIPGPPYQQCCDYTANIRAFPDAVTWDYAQPVAIVNQIANGSTHSLPAMLPLRQTGSIRGASRVMLIWCGPSDLFSNIGYSSGAQLLSWQLDNTAILNGHCFLYPQPAMKSYKAAFYENKIALGVSADWSGGNAVTQRDLVSQNVDTASGAQYSPYNMRFRHMGNTTCNMLFADLHVEPRLLGDVKAKEICLNPVVPGAVPPIAP